MSTYSYIYGIQAGFTHETKADVTVEQTPYTEFRTKDCVEKWIKSTVRKGEHFRNSKRNYNILCSTKECYK